MNTKLHKSLHTVVLAGMVLGAVSVMSGCSHQSAASTSKVPPPSTPTVTGNPQDPIANNPAVGQPNHLSPDMQAQIEHYRTMGTPR